MCQLGADTIHGKEHKMISKWLKISAVTVLAGAAWSLTAPTIASAKDGHLGVRLQSLDGGLAEALDREEGEGVLVGQVTDDSPAAKAGLEKGDIIVRIGDEDVASPSDVRRIVSDREPGDRVDVTYVRDGKSHEVDVELAEAPRGEHRMHVGRELRVQKERGYLGVVTQPLSGDLGSYFGVEDGEGALVSEVVEDSPAAKLGLAPGDVITRIDGTKTEDPGDLSRVVRGIDEEKTVEVVWVRDKKEKRGQATIELRESTFGDLPLLGELRDLVPRFDVHGPRWVEGGGPSPKLDEELREQLDVLREELQALKEEMRSLQRD